MKSNKTQKIIALFLVFGMLLSYIPTNVSANVSISTTDQSEDWVNHPYHIPAFTGEIESDGHPVSTDRRPVNENVRRTESNEGIALTEDAEKYGIKNAPSAFANEVNYHNLFGWDHVNNPADAQLIGSTTAAIKLFAGDFMAADFSKLWAISGDNNGLYKINTSNAQATLVAITTPPDGTTFHGMAGTNDVMYALGNACGSKAILGTIDLTTGAFTEIGQLQNSKCIIDIAYVPATGMLYGVDVTLDQLFKIDPATGEDTMIGSLGYDANFAQGLDYDEVNEVMYWPACNFSGAELRIIDVNTGASAKVGDFSEIEFDSFAIAASASAGDYLVSGTVTDEFDQPISGIDIAVIPNFANGFTRNTKTNAEGVYIAPVDPGSYTVKASNLGYVTQEKPVEILEGASAPAVVDFQLIAIPEITLKGIVSDGGIKNGPKHGYPLSAKITLNNDEYTDVIYSNPFTGEYEIVLHNGVEYQLTVESKVMGYETIQTTIIPEGGAEYVQNFELNVNSGDCGAPGYGRPYDYFYDFEADANGFTFGGTKSSWARGEFTSGPKKAMSGFYGIATNPAGVYNGNENSWAQSPVIDLSSVPASKAVTLEFWNWLWTESKTTTPDAARIDVTADGFKWTTIWGPLPRQDTEYQLDKIEIPRAFYTDKFQFRFGFTSSVTVHRDGWYIDDVGLGLVESSPIQPIVEYHFDSTDEEPWTSVKLGAGEPSWQQGKPVTGVNARSAPNLWATNLDGFYNNSELSALTSPIIDLSAYAGMAIKVDYFDWMEIEVITTNWDYGRIKATADGETWDLIKDGIRRKDPIGGEMLAQYLKLLPKYATENFQIRFEFISDGAKPDWQGWYIDDVSFGVFEVVDDNISCSPLAGGIVAGYAVDRFNQERLIGVRVENEDGFALTEPENGHPDTNGLYWIFQKFEDTSSTTEEIAFTASKDRYETITEDVTVEKSEIVRKDWDLSSGFVVTDPLSLERTMSLFDDPETTNLQLENLGGADAAITVKEAQLGFLPYSIPSIDNESEYNKTVFSTSDEFAQEAINSTSPEISSISPLSPIKLEGGSLAYGVQLQGTKALMRIPDLSSPGNWETVGTLSASFYAGDFLQDDFSKVYAVNDTNGFVTIDTTTGVVTPISVLSTPGNNGIHGLAGADGFFYALSTDCGGDTRIYKLTPDNASLEEVVKTNIPCGIDLAYIPENGLLYSVDIQNDRLFSIDPGNGNVTNIGPTGFVAEYAQGMDYDEANKTLYWAAYAAGGNGQLRILDIETGASELIGAFNGINEVDCFSVASYSPESYDVVPWLSQNPTETQVPAYGNKSIEITFDLESIDQPGDYFAELRFATDTPNAVASVPVTLHVVRPDDWGNIKGQINLLENCDINPTPAKQATVNFYSNEELVQSIQSDKNGQFSYAVIHGAYDVEVEVDGYVSQRFNEITLNPGGDIVLDDIDLRVIAPCLTLDSESFYQELNQNSTAEQHLTLVNTGAEEAVFEIFEKDAGGPFTTKSSLMGADVNLVIDDGTPESAIGIGGTSGLLTINRFSPSEDVFPFTLREVQVSLEGSGNVSEGDPIRIVIYQNTSGSENPALGAELLYQQNETILSSNGWNSFELTEPVTFEGPGDVLVGIIYDKMPGSAYSPALLDKTEPQNRSWAGWWSGAAADIPTLPPPSWTLINNAGEGFAGNWLIRAKGETVFGDDILWLELDNRADVLPPNGGSIGVTLFFDATGLEIGNYFGKLTIKNSPNPTINIPIQLQVSEIQVPEPLSIYLPLIGKP